MKEMIKSVIFAVILAMLFRSLLFEPFHIPSGSMKPTLIEGDYVFVSKYSYGYSRYSFPFGLPLFEGRIFDSEPKRGDIIVFKLPSNTSINYIKRLIGLPGDKIKVSDGMVILNGKRIDKLRMDDAFVVDEKGNNMFVPQYVEQLPDGRKYRVLDYTKFGDLDNSSEFIVPEDHYFFMGDNRDNSLDSRVSSLVGFVPKENLLGPANNIFFSISEPFYKVWRWFVSIRFFRIFSSLEYEE